MCSLLRQVFFSGWGLSILPCSNFAHFPPSGFEEAHGPGALAFPPTFFFHVYLPLPFGSHSFSSGFFPSQQFNCQDLPSPYPISMTSSTFTSLHSPRCENMVSPIKFFLLFLNPPLREQGSQPPFSPQADLPPPLPQIFAFFLQTRRTEFSLLAPPLSMVALPQRAPHFTALSDGGHGVFPPPFWRVSKTTPMRLPSSSQLPPPP